MLIMMLTDGTAPMNRLAGSRCNVSLVHVRAFQMSRIVFSLTPKMLATFVAGYLWDGEFMNLNLKICTACCGVSMVRAFKPLADLIGPGKVF